MFSKIDKYLDTTKYDLSCSETIIYTANDYYDLGLSKSALKMMAPFSGGMYEEETCGILTGCIAVLGALFTNDVAHNSSHLKDIILDFKNQFRKKLGSTNCSTLKGINNSQIIGCRNLIIDGGLLLEEIVKKYEHLR